MNNKYDYPWRSFKEQLASDNGEITSVWMMGPKNRRFALQKGIYSWKNRKCNSKILKASKGKQGYIVDKILKINRQKRKLIDPPTLQDPGEEWLSPAKLEFFIDFETWNGAIDSLEESTFANNNQLCYLIGVMDNQGQYKKFVADRLTTQHEGHMVKEFVKYIPHQISKAKVNETEVNFYHWSKAEQIWWGNMKQRHSVNLFCNWIDLLEIFQTEPIVIKGSLTYSLKDIAKAMFNNKMISSTWSTDLDALGTMVLVQQADEKACLERSSLVTSEEINRISQYNQVDVKVLLEILNYLRSKYGLDTKNTKRVKK